MIWKALPGTGVSIPEVGMGTWNYRGGVDPLRAGFEAGALFVDTGESYGSETVVGKALKGIRESVFVASKVSPSHFRFGDLLQSADESLRRLGLDYIDLYQLHEPCREIPIEETMMAMEKLVDDGKIRFIGVSNFSVSQLKKAQSAMCKHRIVANQVRYNVIDRTIETDLLSYCKAERVLVIAYSPLGRELGRIFDCDPKGVLSQVAREAGKTVPQVAINWCLRKENVVAIPKGNSVSHVLDNCGASDWQLSSEQIQTLEQNVWFRRRTRAETLVREMMPRALEPLIRESIRRLPAGLRRQFR